MRVPRATARRKNRQMSISSARPWALVAAASLTLAAIPDASAQGTTKAAPIATSLTPQRAPVAVASPCTADDKVAVESITATPSSTPGSHPLAGTKVTFTVRVKNVCSGYVVAVPWNVTRTQILGPPIPPLTHVILSGTIDRLAAGASVDVTGDWIAAVGANQNIGAHVDPNHTLESAAASANNTKYITGYAVDDVAVAPNWAVWATAAKEAAKQGTNKWLGEIQVRGAVNGPVMTFDRGTTLRAVNRPYFVDQVMVASGAPPLVVGAFHDATIEAWGSWIAGYQGPQNPIAFPTFAAFPGNAAPPTPAASPSLSLKLGSSNNDGSMSSGTVAAFIKARLGSMTSQPGADAAINDFASSFNSRFTAWKGTATLTSLIGSGPVPMFAPPAVPAGPVKGGVVIGTIGGPSF